MTVSLARRLVEPTWSSVPGWHLTYGPAVAELAARVGRTPDPEQELILDAVFAQDRFGRSVAFETDIIASRQELKTATIEMCELGWIFVSEVGLVLHTAHRQFAVEAAFRSLRKLIRSSPALSKRLAPGRSKGITTGNGSEAIEFNTGQRIDYATRTADTGRSESVDKLVIDEAFAEDEEQSGAVIPTLGAVVDPQIVRASSGGRLKSKVLREVRDRGRAGTDPRQAYFEWGDKLAWVGCLGEDCDHAKTAEGCALDDEGRWAVIMPSLGFRKRVENVRAFRQSMPPLEFAHELMVWWDDPPVEVKDQLFGEDWPACAVDVGPRPVPRAIGVAVSVDLAWASIGAASRLGARRFIGAVDRRHGTSWLVVEAVRIAAQQGCPIGIDKAGPGADLLPELRTACRVAGVKLLELDLADMKSACASVFTGVTEAHEVVHMHDTELDTAIAGAVKRNVGDRFLWGRRPSASDVSMLEAGTIADWVAARPASPPPSPQSVSAGTTAAASATADLASANF